MADLNLASLLRLPQVPSPWDATPGEIRDHLRGASQESRDPSFRRSESVAQTSPSEQALDEQEQREVEAATIATPGGAPEEVLSEPRQHEDSELSDEEERSDGFEDTSDEEQDTALRDAGIGKQNERADGPLSPQGEEEEDVLHREPERERDTSEDMPDALNVDPMLLDDEDDNDDTGATQTPQKVLAPLRTEPEAEPDSVQKVPQAPTYDAVVSSCRHLRSQR
ncbi:hypothetical protein CALVIDRAFT_569595 [Calocera viscosa TUFC12733]|uniref:Uncharacterized protein n=1 Tax=Calocera viscosa (strain TUFC12733) TaxID=1330018 RepID=A0A167FTI9_CALVF|nr:hypothetical protein CALVIDRAFT_569595 [Calocera viscosa TUFC12733]